MLYMAALSATMWNPELAAVHQRLRERGKAHRITLVAVMRRPIVTANALRRERRVWSARVPAAG